MSERGWHRTQVTVHGRRVELAVGLECDGQSQFPVRVVVDGKERYAAWFTDKGEPCERHASPLTRLRGAQAPVYGYDERGRWHE
jgi:hypothetical protein